MKRLVICAMTALLAIPLQTSAAQAKEDAADKAMGALTVTVTGLKNGRGNVLISLFNQPDGFPSKHKKAFRIAVAPAKGFEQAEFKNLPQGTYAVAVCHDENGSLKLETGFFGKPKEGVGTSNNVMKKVRPPTFAEASFKILEETRQIKINIRY